MMNRTALALAALLLAAAGPPQVAPPSVAPTDIRIPTPDTTGDVPFFAKDGGIQFKAGRVPLPTNPFEYITILPGQPGAGATLLCDRSNGLGTGTCNFVALGAGQINLGNGLGYWLQFIDNGSALAPSSYLTLQQGNSAAATTANPNTVIFNQVSPSGTAQNIAILPFNGAFIAGPGARTSQGICPGGAIFGSFTQCNGSYSLLSGSQTYDQSMLGSRCHSSGPVSGASASSGSNQVCEQTLQATLAAGISFARFTPNGSSGVYKGLVFPIQTSQHGVFNFSAECYDNTSTDQAAWSIPNGVFGWKASAPRLLVASGAGAPASSDSSLSTLSLAVSVDTTNANMNFTVTRSGTTSVLGCTAYLRWEMRTS